MKNKPEAPVDVLERNERTPLTEADSILNRLCKLFLDMGIGETEDDFDKMLRKMCDNRVSAEAAEDEFSSEYASTDPDALISSENTEPIVFCIFISVCHCMDAVKEYKSGNNIRAWTHLCDANYWQGLGRGSQAYGMAAIEKRSGDAKKGAQEKLRRDPKQDEKLFIYSCWKDWKENPNRYASKAAFARDMLPKCDYLKSQKKIEDWCREWEKQQNEK